jgi:hypothetical protein
MCGMVIDPPTTRPIDNVSKTYRLVYASKAEPVFSFVLISPGEDGVFERDAPELYFDAPREDIVGRLERDIVFRDGEPMTIASAK